MINEENLNKIYEKIAYNLELTTKELNDFGFNSKDINMLIEQKKLVRIKRGYYKFLNFNKLYELGKNKLSNKDYDNGIKYFERCLEIDPSNIDVSFKLFFNSIKNKEYEKSLKYFDVLLKNEDNYIEDNNLILYLLSLIVDLPDDYKKYVKNIKYNDIKIKDNDSRYHNIVIQNKIRKCVISRKFPYALNLYKELNPTGSFLNIREFLIKNLINQVLDKEMDCKNLLIKMVESKKYNEIIDFLEKKNENNYLSITDKYILELSKKILIIKETNIIPEKVIVNTSKIFEAIDGNNFKLALELSENYNLEKNVNVSSNVFHKLLVDICLLIEDVSKQNEDKIKFIEIKEEKVEKNKIKDTNDCYLMLIDNILKGDLNNAFINLNDYLNSIGKIDYEFLLINLIKLGILKKEFNEVLLVLSYLNYDKYLFSISDYIQKFYLSLSIPKFDEARIYLDIITKSSKLDTNYSFSEYLLLFNVLELTEKIFNSKNKIIDDSLVVEEKTEVLIEEDKSANFITYEINSSNDKEDNEIFNNEDKIYFEEKYKLLLKEQGIIILNPMKEERALVIHELVKKYNDVVAFDMNEDKKVKVVLKYNPYFKDKVDVKSLLKMGNKAYDENKYLECIDCYLKVLHFFKKPKSGIYAKIGLAYLKNNMKNKAIPYLEIATYLGKLENLNIDFTDLINKINGLMDKSNYKPNFEMLLEDFENPINDYFGIDNFDVINNYIIESGLDVDTISSYFELNDEQIDLIKLIYAREYYITGNYTFGDEFLNSVEKKKKKTNFVNQKLLEVKRNRKFYINREEESIINLPLKLSLRKK